MLGVPLNRYTKKCLHSYIRKKQRFVKCSSVFFCFLLIYTEKFKNRNTLSGTCNCFVRNLCIFDQIPLQRYYLKLLLPNYPDYIGTILCKQMAINIINTEMIPKNRNCVLKNRK